MIPVSCFDLHLVTFQAASTVALQFNSVCQAASRALLMVSVGGPLETEPQVVVSSGSDSTPPPPNIMVVNNI